MVQTLGTAQGTNDLYLDSSGNIALLSGLPAVVCACKTASQTQLGECVLETSVGLPNFQALWTGAPNVPLWESYLRNTLNNVSGVQQVKNIAIQQNKSVLSYQATIQTQYGNAEIAT